MSTFNLFVYDTMMHCIPKHVWYLPRDLKPVRGKIEGNLYISGWTPTITFPDKAGLGSADYEKDISLQEGCNRMRLSNLHFHLEYGRVYGELFKIENYNEILKNLPKERAFLSLLAEKQSGIRYLDNQEQSESDEAEDQMDSGFYSEMHYYRMRDIRRSLVAVDIGERELVWGWTHHCPVDTQNALQILTGDYCDYRFGLPDHDKQL